MRVRKLAATNFRNLENIELTAGSGLNLLIGPNGAGKTSVLETMVVLAKGRSFRGGRQQDLIGPHSGKFQLHLRVATDDGIEDKLGLERNASGWRARKNGTNIQTLADFSPTLPLVIIEPNSHNLIDGAPDNRRRMIDWGVFHVKPTFLTHWQRYQRALKQRNAQLKQNQLNTDLLDVLDAQLVKHGKAVTLGREAYVADLKLKTEALIKLLSTKLPQINISFARGWSGPELQEYLNKNRERDREIGATAGGPHRADLKLSITGEKARDRLSRGQQKLLAAALLLAQAEIMSDLGRTPVLLIDDLASEFDREHLNKILKLLASTEAQTWITGVDKSLIKRTKEVGLEPFVFHVKQGQVTPA